MSAGQPCLPGAGRCCPQQRQGEFNSFPDSEEDLIKEWRLQLRCWWPGTGSALLPSTDTVLQAFYLSVKQAAAFGWGFASPLLLQPPCSSFLQTSPLVPFTR